MCLFYFQTVCRNQELSALEFFELAYIAEKKRFPQNLGDAYAQFLMHSVLPDYVLSFLKKLQENEEGEQLELPLAQVSER